MRNEFALLICHLELLAGARLFATTHNKTNQSNHKADGLNEMYCSSAITAP
jgi:hypothetical protein